MRDERAAAIEVLRRHAQVTDSYEASPEPTVEKCLSDVRASHAYVLILGRRYGWVPAGADDPDALSITEQEYEACRGDGVASIPRLVFIRTTNADRFNDDEARPQTAARMRRFRARAAANQLAYPFDTLEQFKLALAEAIVVTRQQHFKEVRKPVASEGGLACLRLVPWMLGNASSAHFSDRGR